MRKMRRPAERSEQRTCQLAGAKAPGKDQKTEHFGGCGFGFFKLLSPNKFGIFFKLGPYLLCKNAVHGPPPYKKVPQEQFLAPYSAVCLSITQMRSVSLCRKGELLSQYIFICAVMSSLVYILPCQSDPLSGSDGRCLVPHLSAGGDHPPQRCPPPASSCHWPLHWGRQSPWSVVGIRCGD